MTHHHETQGRRARSASRPLPLLAVLLPLATFATCGSSSLAQADERKVAVGLPSPAVSFPSQPTVSFSSQPTVANSSLAQNAQAAARDLEDLFVTLGGYITCFDAKQLEAAISRSDAAYAKQLEKSSCMKKMAAVASARGYQTVTVGISGGGAFLVGSNIDTGFAFDTTGTRGPTLYQTKAISLGIQVGGGLGLNVGLSKGSNAKNAAGVDAHGFTFEAGAGAGAGTGIWYDYDGQLDGVSVSALAGASGKAGAYNRINTSFYDLDGNNPVVCGAANQRACKLWERIPSCDAGLYEDLLQGMCRKPAPKKKLACGAKNQRPCKLWERVPSCNAGLAEDFFAGKCK